MIDRDIQPIFIVGVPRSGTTLYRVALDSHSQVAGAPETGWITGGYCTPSLREMLEMLQEHNNGPVSNLSGVTPEVIFDAARVFLDRIFGTYLDVRGKTVLVLKTPDDIPYLDFIERLFPRARYLHIVRDGRDVACSTYALRGTFFNTSVLKEHGSLTIQNAVRRWVDWETRVGDFMADKKDRLLVTRYEDLVNRPAEELTRTCRFLQIEYETEMVNYSEHAHEYPDYEAGSNDVRKHPGFTADNVNRWLRQIPRSEWGAIDEMAGPTLAARGYKRCLEFEDVGNHLSPMRGRKWWHIGRKN